MQRLLPFFLLLAVFTFAACEDDDVVQDSLNYDGPNFTAPLMPQPGLNTFAAFFPASEVQEFSGRSLESIRFWMQNLPNSIIVRVYSVGPDDRAPGGILYELDITSRVRDAGWYTHVIPGGLEIPEEGLWLAVAADLPEANFQAMGCDEGFNFNPNGDRLLFPTGGVWTSFEEFTGSERIHWNIRGFVAEE